MTRSESCPKIAIACGGTGGHLFPGLAIADVLQELGCEIALLVSQKEVDQEAVKSAQGMYVVSLPAIALQDGNWTAFVRGFWHSFSLCRGEFRGFGPRAVLAMGGFTSAPPVLAGKAAGAATFLHEANSVPGRANRWLSPWVDEVFIGFPSARSRLYNQSIRHMGMPVRSHFKPADSGACRIALGLDPARPVLLVMGGSQGASAINRLVQAAIPVFASQTPELQFLHLTGPGEQESMQAAYAAQRCRAVVRPFLTEMELALGAATVAINRAGASSLAELAAMEIPAILIPYPYATENHQFYNASALAGTGAARIVAQVGTTPENLARAVLELLRDPAARSAMQSALKQWQFPDAAAEIAREMLNRIGVPRADAAGTGDSMGTHRVPFRIQRPWPGRNLEFGIASGKSE